MDNVVDFGCSQSIHDRCAGVETISYTENTYGNVYHKVSLTILKESPLEKAKPKIMLDFFSIYYVYYYVMQSFLVSTADYGSAGDHGAGTREGIAG